MASSSSCSSISRGRDVMGLGNGLCTAVGNTYATCNSELVLLAISAAVVRSRLASLEPSVASRIFVGNMLISSLLLDGFPLPGLVTVPARSLGGGSHWYQDSEGPFETLGLLPIADVPFGGV